MPRLLLVSYVWPPQGGSGPLRRVKLVKYLVEMGWDVEVLTANEVYTRQRDEGLAREVPASVDVLRARSFELSSLNSVFHRSSSRSTTAVVPSKSIPTRIGRTIQRYLLVPDREVGWWPAAYRAGTRSVQHSRPDVIASFSYPFTCHLVARQLARRYRIPLVTNFSDFWVGNRILYDVLPTPFHRWAARKLESRVVRSAAVNVVITDGMRKAFSRRYSDLASDRWAVVYNGFDPSDRPPRSSEARRDAGALQIVYAGLAFTGPNSSNDPRSFLTGLDLLLQRRPELRGAIEVRFIGTTDEGVSSAVAQHGLDGVVTCTPHLPYPQVLSAIASSDVALLLMTDEQASAVLPTKVFDYLGSGTQILAVSYPGETTEVSSSDDRTVVARPDDPEGVANAIELLIERWQSGDQRRSTWDPTPWTRAETARRFNDVLVRASHSGF